MLHVVADALAAGVEGGLLVGGQRQLDDLLDAVFTDDAGNTREQALFAVLAALLISSVGGVVGASVHFFTGETAAAVVLLGMSVTVFAATMLLAPLAKRALRFLWTTAGKWLKGIKKMFVNRREERE